MHLLVLIVFAVSVASRALLALIFMLGLGAAIPLAYADDNANIFGYSLDKKSLSIEPGQNGMVPGYKANAAKLPHIDDSEVTEFPIVDPTDAPVLMAGKNRTARACEWFENPSTALNLNGKQAPLLTARFALQFHDRTSLRFHFSTE